MHSLIHRCGRGQPRERLQGCLGHKAHDAQEVAEEVGLFHQQNRRLEAERGNINTAFNQVFLGGSQKKDENLKGNGQAPEPRNSQIC